VKILIYGFGPYRTFSDNITEKIIRALPKHKNVSVHVFDVTFDREMFLKIFKRIQPDIIIGMGQHPKARKIRIERKARNEWSEKKSKGKRIDRSHPEHLYSTLSIAIPRSHLKEVTVTYDAGNYVCNFSMFTALTAPEEVRVPYTFLHIPKDYPVHKGVGFLTQLIRSFQETTF